MPQEITDPRRTEAELRASEARFRVFVDHATDAFFLHTDDLIVIDVNRRACESLGYTRDELIGMHPRDFDVGLDPATLALVTDRVGTGEPVTFESLHRRKDGSVFPVEVRAGRFEQEGRHFRLSLVRDISERERAADELSDIKERFRVLAESALTGIYHVQADSIAYVNPAMARMFGYTVEELVGRHPLEIVWPADRALVAENLRRRLVEGVDHVRYEYRGLRKDGSVFAVEVHGRRVVLGGKVSVIGTLVDNSERRRAEEELRRSRSYLAEGQRLSRTGSISWSPASGESYWSEEMYRILELDPASRPAVEHLIQRTHPDDRPAVQAAIERAEREHRGFELERRLLMPAGSVKHVRVVVQARTDEAGLPEFVGAVQDVTQQRRAEAELRLADARFRTYFDHATDALFVHDETGRVVDVNPQACENLGYTRDELVGMFATAFDPSLTLDDVVRIGRRLASGEAFTVESVHQRKDGSRFPVEVRLRAFWDGNRQYGLSLVRDITERKRLEAERERLRQLETERETAIANERSRLAGEIHDTLAQGLAMIVMQLADAEAKLGPLWAQAEKPLGMVRELAVESLAYARRSVNMLRPGISAGGLVRPVRDVVDSVRRHFGGTIELSVAGGAVLLPTPVESALIGIAREALTNAVRHSGASGIRIELEFLDTGAVRLAVIDEGVGFDTARVRPDSYGMLSMQERAARAAIALTFVTAPGAGTEVVASWSPAVEREPDAP